MKQPFQGLAYFHNEDEDQLVTYSIGPMTVPHFRDVIVAVLPVQARSSYTIMIIH